MLGRYVWQFLAISMVTLSCSLQASFTSFQITKANPGELSFSYFKPEQPAKALVVLLHGCAQQGESFARQSGFVDQAKQYGFALLIPQQAKSNNIQQCFNWFSPLDNKKNSGETASIKNAIEQFKGQFHTTETYITGLSAGGAMASNLLSHYPEIFTAGSVIAGIPYPCADNLVKAISCMKSGPVDSPQLLAAKLLKRHNNWPRLTVITGEQDKIVAPKNAKYLAKQWAVLNGLKPSEIITGQSYGDTLEVSKWGDTAQAKVELLVVKGLGHGIPVNSTITGGGSAGGFFLDSQFSAAKYLADIWF